MRVVEMHPGEEARAAGGVERIDPGGGLGDRLVARSLNLPQAERLGLLEVEIVEVALEALRDSPLVVEDVGGNEAAGAKTGG